MATIRQNSTVSFFFFFFLIYTLVFSYEEKKKQKHIISIYMCNNMEMLSLSLNYILPFLVDQMKENVFSVDKEMTRIRF